MVEARIKPGDVVLTQRTGGVSIFALQFAKAAGCRVISTSSSDDKLEHLKAMGADELINYKQTPDWAGRALELTDGRAVRQERDAQGHHGRQPGPAGRHDPGHRAELHRARDRLELSAATFGTAP